MAVIYSYPQVSTVDGTELLICSQTSSNNATRSMTTAAFGAYISASYGPGGSIYLANGTLSGDRTLVGGGNSLTFSGLSLFTVASPVELGSTFKLTTGASLNHVLTSDASGNAAWAAPAAGSFIGLTDTPLVWHGHAAGQPVTINPTLDGLVFATSLEAAHGGTGINTYAVGDILYADSVSTLTKLVAGTDTHVLTLAAGVPTWAAPAGGVTSVTGTTPIASSGGATPAISISAATTGAAGSMSAADKTKLDGIATGAQPGTITGIAVSLPLTTTGGTSPALNINPATVSLPGVMSSADKTKLDGLGLDPILVQDTGSEPNYNSSGAPPTDIPDLTYTIVEDGSYLLMTSIDFDPDVSQRTFDIFFAINGTVEPNSNVQNEQRHSTNNTFISASWVNNGLESLTAGNVITIQGTTQSSNMDLFTRRMILIKLKN